jgi:hypothetical protein
MGPLRRLRFCIGCCGLRSDRTRRPAQYVASNPSMGLGAIADFSKADIGKRAAVYVAVAQQVWQSP